MFQPFILKIKTSRPSPRVDVYFRRGSADLPEKGKSLTLRDNKDVLKENLNLSFSYDIWTFSEATKSEYQYEMWTKRAVIIFWCRECLISNYISRQA